MERLLWEICALGVRSVVVESRRSHQDDRDRAVVMGWRIDFGKPSGPDREPLLWLPDIVAGAVGSARADGDLQLLVPLRSVLTEHAIALK